MKRSICASQLFLLGLLVIGAAGVPGCKKDGETEAPNLDNEESLVGSRESYDSPEDEQAALDETCHDLALQLLLQLRNPTDLVILIQTRTRLDHLVLIDRFFLDWSVLWLVH
jgi:hypothetical protein